MKPAPTPFRFPAVFGAPLLVLLAGCSIGQSGSHSGDRVATANEKLTISPARSTLAVGQSVQFSAGTPWGGGVVWSVLPPDAGTITDQGLFTAAGRSGTCSVVAMWKGDVRYTATAEATILPAPPPVAATPNLVQTSGSQQGAADGTVKNGSVVGEGMLATTSKDPTGAFQVRHGFTPPVPTQKM